jgi:hypothetical protein
MPATDARPVPRKGEAYRLTFPILDADGDLVTAAAGLDSEISQDGGTFVDCTNEATELATSSGMYYLDLTATEMNADTVAIIVKTSTSGAKTTPIVLYPEEAGDIRVNVTQYNSQTVSTTVSGRPDINLGHISGSAVSTSSAQLGVNVVNMGGSAGTFAGGRPEVNVSHWRGTAAAAPTTAGIPRVAIEAEADFAQAAADKVWSTTTRTLSAFGFTVTVGTNNDKTGYSLSSAAIQAIWDALTSALTTVGSIGKRIVDNLDATISSRASQTSLDAVDDYVDTEVAAIKAKTDQLNFGVTGKVDANVTHVNETEVTGNGSTTPWGPI